MLYLLLGFFAVIGVMFAVATNPPLAFMPAAFTVLASALAGILVVALPIIALGSLFGFFLILTKRFWYSPELASTEPSDTESTYESDCDEKEKTEINEQFNPYEILGIRLDASPQEIKISYINQMKLYHPDRVNHLGDALRDLANQKAKDIQRAFETLMPQL